MLEDAKEEFDRAPAGRGMHRFLKILKTKVLEDHCRYCKEKTRRDKEAAEAEGEGCSCRGEGEEGKAAQAAVQAGQDQPPARGVWRLLGAEGVLQGALQVPAWWAEGPA